MTGWLRRAGRGIDPTGATVIWSVSEGSRGRRWREARIAPEGGLISSLLLETDPEGRFLHTELSTADGLLTLHPEGDGTLHGNIITSGEVEHAVGLRWSDDALLLVDGSMLSLAAAAYRLRHVPVWTSTSAPVVVVRETFILEPDVVRVERLGDTTWRFVSDHPIEVTHDGLPALRDAEEWPLELE